MGQSGLSETASCTRFGDVGLLRALPECPPSPLGYLSYTPDGERGVDELGDAVACQIQLGTDGCGLEQQLEAALKALTPSTADVAFPLGSLGHGDGPNAGFLRDDSILAIVVVSDEDDCSYPETSIGFASTSPNSPYAEIPLNYRCQGKPELLHPIERYIETLPKLRSGLPGSIVFGMIAGIPPELASGEHDLDEILNDPRMAFVPDERTAGDTPTPACSHTRETGELVEATPARRLLEVARAFGDHAVVASICEETFAGPVEQLARRIGGVLACPADPIVF
jgi:hypothetical protein